MAKLTALLVLISALAAPGSAAAKSGEIERARQEVERAGVLVDRAVDALKAGQRQRSYELARNAYLDHYEIAEIPLRLRDGGQVLEAEYRFAELRDGIEAGQSVGTVRSKAIEVQEALDNSERLLSDEGVAAPALAAGFSFSIIFREGLEAVLMIALLLGTLEAGRAAGYRRPLAYGVGAALLATVVTWLLAMFVIEIAPVNRELLEAGAALLAVAVLFWLTFWLVSRLEQRRWMEFMKARVSSAIAAGSTLAFAGLGFTAIYREGFETVLFYQALLLFSSGLEIWVALGAAVGLAVLAAIGWAILRLGRRLPVKAFLTCSATIVLLLSLAFIGNGVRALQSADVVGIHLVDAGIFQLPIYLAELTGIHPTVEGLAAQTSLAAIYMAGLVYLFVVTPIRRSRALDAGGA